MNQQVNLIMKNINLIMKKMMILLKCVFELECFYEFYNKVWSGRNLDKEDGSETWVYPQEQQYACADWLRINITIFSVLRIQPHSAVCSKNGIKWSALWLIGLLLGQYLGGFEHHPGHLGTNLVLFVLWENSKIFDLILISTPTILFPFILILCCPNKFQFPFLFFTILL